MLRSLIFSIVLISLATANKSNGQESDLLNSVENLDLINVSAKVVQFKGKSAVNLSGTRQSGAPDMRNRQRQNRSEQQRSERNSQESGTAPGTQSGERRPAATGANRARRQRPESLAIVKGTDFKNGTIEVELAGRPSEAAGANARGFVGIAFHVEKSEPVAYDCFYLRPTNGRADDQLRRNHSCQYMSHPDFPFNKLRREFPGVYESYVDLEPGAWTAVKITVDGAKARLFVNGADQPCMIVNDLKRGGERGLIALWMEQSTDAYFRNLKMTAAD